jgi:hypothetical protein
MDLDLPPKIAHTAPLKIDANVAQDERFHVGGSSENLS